MPEVSGLTQGTSSPRGLSRGRGKGGACHPCSNVSALLQVCSYVWLLS